MIPNPGECHPALVQYRDWIVAWLEGRGPVYDVIEIPISRSRHTMFDSPAEVMDDVPGRLTFTQRKCAGPAPYVGRPFVYMWRVAVDNLGRMVAAEAQLHYTMTEWEYGTRV